MKTGEETAGGDSTPAPSNEQLRTWLAANPGPLAIELASRSETVRLTSAAGHTFEVQGISDVASLFTSVGARRLWASDAAQQERDNREFLEALGWPRIHCAGTVDRVLAAEKQKPVPVRGAAVAALMTAHAGAPAAHKRIAMAVEDEDRMWRTVTRRGYIPNEQAMIAERQKHTRVIEAFTRTAGFDIRSLSEKLWDGQDQKQIARVAANRAENARRDGLKSAWLTERNIAHDRNTDHKWAEPSRCNLSQVSDEHRSDWEAYDAAYQSMHRLVPLNQVQKEIGPDFRIHPLIRVNKAVTGRMSIEKPGLQNLPHKRQSIRHVIAPEPGFDVVSVDHSNAELRVAARLMGSASFTKRVMETDIYQELADYTGQPRSEEKWRSIAFMYSMKKSTLAREVGIEQAELTHEALHKLVPEIPAFVDEMTDRARRGEKFETLLGRPLPQLDGKTFETRFQLQTNLSVQGSARDYFGLGIRRAANAMGEDRMWIPLHDELFVLSPRGESETTKAKLLDAMTLDLGEGVVLTGKPSVSFGRWG